MFLLLSRYVLISPNSLAVGVLTISNIYGSVPGNRPGRHLHGFLTFFDVPPPVKQRHPSFYTVKVRTLNRQTNFRLDKTLNSGLVPSLPVLDSYWNPIGFLWVPIGFLLGP